MGLEALILELAAAHPRAAAALAFLGLVRLVNKPLFAVFHKIAERTSTKRDDLLLFEFETSKAYLLFTFLLDMLFSVKLRK